MIALGPMMRLATELLYPSRCAGCGTFHLLLCPRCAEGRISAIGPGRCPRCAASEPSPGTCIACRPFPELDRWIAAYEMEGVTRKLVHALKYGRVRAVAPLMAGEMASLRAAAPFDIAIPVPLHRSSFRSRGFNQSEVLLEHLDWPSEMGWLRRTRKTGSQVRQTDAAARRRNVAGAFTYSGPPLDGKVVAVVDDVITTGATVNECAVVLRAHGARSVIAIAYARASPRSGAKLRD